MADEMNGESTGAQDGDTYARVSFEDEERVRVAFYVRSAVQNTEGRRRC